MARRVSGIGALAWALVAVPAVAVVVPPGGVVLISGSNSAGGVVLEDSLRPFEIRNGSGVLLFQGILQDRVVRTGGSNELQFNALIRDTNPALPGAVSSIERSNFAGYLTDVDWSPSSIGTVAPDQAARTFAPGTRHRFEFNFTPLLGGQTSKFCWTRTDGFTYGPGGVTTIRLTSGESVDILTWRPLVDGTAPVVEITSPGPFGCSCDPVTFIGTADDPEGFASYTLEYSANPGGPWGLIAQGTSPVVAGVLGVWNTLSVSQGYYFVRLSATNDLSLTSVFTTLVFVDRQFDVVDVRSPLSNGIYGGNLCFDGTVSDHCFDRYRVEYRPSGIGPFLPVDPVNPVYTAPVVNDPFATWNTRTGPTSVVDGLYDVRVTGQDICGHIQSQTRTVEVDNTAPTATITTPTNCSYRCGVIEVRGTADDANLAGWALQYTGGASHTWTTIASGSSSVVNGVLANWNTAGLPRCAYTLRLIVSDQASVNCGDGSNSSEYTVSINVGAYADCNADGVLTVADFGCFQTSFILGCP